MEMPDYIHHTRAAFDSAAETFDKDDLGNPILAWMRNVVHKVYLENFSPGSKLLELNAGTGIDAAYLCSRGMNVLATDISPKMLAELNRKIEKYSLEGKLRSMLKPFDCIDEIGEGEFDGAVSNFGGLNCIPGFTKLSADLSKKLKPGGKFIAVVINKLCPWEIFYYLLRLQWNTAFRRLTKDGIDANLNGEKIRTFYFTPKEFSKHFANDFAVEKIYSHGLFTPPPYLVGVYNKLKPLVKILMKMDELTCRLFPFNRFGDHFIIIMSRK
jgi:SAM-dependent methyltransferase